VPVGSPSSTILDPSLDSQNIEIHDDTTCTSPIGIFFALVLAPNVTDAAALCVSSFGLATANDYTAAYPNLWRCTV
jgi:hypothetical protein